jgi:hypothetical protein
VALIQHRQIKDRLEANYIPLIDVSDSVEANRPMVALSRATAALALVYLADVDPKTACENLVDGGGDNGIDAILYDAGEKTLYLVQSKWNNEHTGGVDNGSILKFLQGVKNLLNSKYAKFNKKVVDRRPQIDVALSHATKVVLVVVHTGSGTFSSENKQSLTEFLSEVDETGDLVSFRIIDQNILHTYISSGVQGASISETLQIFDWGWMNEPVRAYYGKIAASDIVALYKKYGPKLFSKNIRMFLGLDSSANRGIIETLEATPEHIWYFNNGITALANTVTRKAIGGNSREAGQFDCDGLSVVNGAQTIGSLASIAENHTEKLLSASIPVRIIQTQGAPDGFSALITRHNNTQNRIDPRNFVALDPVQERLRTEFLVDGIDYEYRQGEVEHSAGARLGLVEATVALACTDSDVDLSTQAKREIGRLWDDISRAPYKRLFNDGQTSERIWRRVQAFRRLDQQVSAIQIESIDKEKSIAVHGNRFLVHLAYQRLLKLGAGEDLQGVNDEALKTEMRSSFNDLTSIISGRYADNYLASLFKNQTKCKEIIEQLT